MSEDNLFEKFGLSVEHGKPEVGGVYPLYGMITKFLSEEVGNVVVELNFNIELKLNIDSADKVEIIKSRAFEPGIFVTEIIQIEGGIKGDCTTVVFGRKQNLQQ